MTPQERQLIDDLFDRLSRLENSPRDPDAQAAIAQGLRTAPNAVYALVQTVLVQDEALKRAHERIQELEGGASDQRQSGGFLDSMRDAIFGQGQPQGSSQGSSQGSVPNVRAPGMGDRPVWNSGQVMQQGQGPGGQQYGGGYGQPAGYGAQQPPMGGGGEAETTAPRRPRTAWSAPRPRRRRVRCRARSGRGRPGCGARASPRGASGRSRPSSRRGRAGRRSAGW